MTSPVRSSDPTQPLQPTSDAFSTGSMAGDASGGASAGYASASRNVGGLSRSAPIRTLPSLSAGLTVSSYAVAHNAVSKAIKPLSGAVTSSTPRTQMDLVQPTASFGSGTTANATINQISQSLTEKADQEKMKQQQQVRATQIQSYDSSPRHDRLATNTQYKNTTQSNHELATQLHVNRTSLPSQSEQLQPHIVTLPIPQQTQVHPLGNNPQPPQTYPPQQIYQTKLSPRNQKPVLSQTQTSNLSSAFQSASQPQKMQQQFPPTRKSQPLTPDEEVDAFLINTLESDNQWPSNSARTPNKQKIRPPPLPQTESILAKVKLLASRRAWGDVIRVTNETFFQNTMDVPEKNNKISHCDIYSLLIDAESLTTPSIDESGTSDPSLVRLRNETCELIALRFISHLKLRRYADLRKEVGQLGLMPHLPPHPSCIASTSAVPMPIPNSDDIPPSSVSTNTNSSTEISQSLSWKEGSIHSSNIQDKLPSWVPYSLRILAAQQLQYIDGSSKAIDVLYDMRDRTVRTNYWSTYGMEKWRSTIDNALVNVFVRKKEWRLALLTLEDMLNGLDEGVEREVDWWYQFGGNHLDAVERGAIRETIFLSASVELLSRQIRILLQDGALSVARTLQKTVELSVDRIKKIYSEMGVPSSNQSHLVRLSEESTMVRQAPIRSILNEGLILFAQFRYTDAISCFDNALKMHKEPAALMTESIYNQPPGCPSWKDLSSPTLGFDVEPSSMVECLNNLSLCYLYSGNMRLAVREMEGLVRENPTWYLTEGMTFNLCTLYELGSDGEECTRRKKVLQRVAKRFFLHDIGIESFRLN